MGDGPGPVRERSGAHRVELLPLGTAGISQSALRKFPVPLDPAVWTQLKKARQLYWRVGLGTTQNMATWTWSVPRDYQINHDPKAEAGAPQRAQLASGGLVTTAVSLDGSASTDPDAGSVLTHSWELKSPPAGFLDPIFLADIRSHLAQGGATPVPFPAGTAIPRSGQGVYTFRLTVEDDDPPSIVYGTRGRASAETTVVLGTCLQGICIDSPTGAEPARASRPPRSASRSPGASTLPCASPDGSSRSRSGRAARRRPLRPCTR